MLMKTSLQRSPVLLLLVLLLGALPCFSNAHGSTPQTKATQLASIDQQIKTLQGLLEQFDKGDSYIVPVPSLPGGLLVVSKDQVVNTMTTEVLLGDIDASEVPTMISALKQFSDQAAATARHKISQLMALRDKILNPTGARPTGYFRLKEGYPKFLNQMKSGPGYTFDYEVGTSVTIHYTEFNTTSGNPVEDFTMSCSSSGLGATTLEAGKQMDITLDGTWNYSTDAGRFDGFGPNFNWRGTWISLLDAQPRHGSLGAWDSAALWLGRFTSGIVYSSDHRKISIKLANSGTAGRDYTVMLDFGKYGQLVWTYEWVPF